MNREELFEYKNNKEWVEEKKAKLEDECEKIQKMITSYQKVTKYYPVKQDSMAENLELLLDMKLETLDFANKLEGDLKKIEHALLKMKQPYRNILTDVYVNGDSLVMVAHQMNYKYNDICRKHGEALKKYDEL